MLRKTLFWLHLGVGIVCGIVIAIMSFTGAALTFEKEIIAWAERDARRIEAPPGQPVRLSLEEALRRARAAQPELRVANIAVSAVPDTAVVLGTPTNQTWCVNPYTGEVRPASAPRTRAFMQTMRSWHTRLNVAARPGNWGAAVNSAANLAFVGLCLTGFVLWWPRTWTWRTLRPSLWFTPGARGRARDWNWHNVIGLWSLPLLFVLAGTGVVLSYRWAGDLVFRLAGEQPPARMAGPPPGRGGAAPAAGSASPVGNAATRNAVLSPDALLARVQSAVPAWETITLRFSPPLSASAPSTAKTFTVVAKERNAWPPFSTTTLTLDATSGEVVRTETFAALSTGTRARRWIRLLHSGEALGTVVQFLSAVACVGGCFLVYTGLALSWRRFFGRPSDRA